MRKYFSPNLWSKWPSTCHKCAGHITVGCYLSQPAVSSPLLQTELFGHTSLVTQTRSEKRTNGNLSRDHLLHGSMDTIQDAHNQTWWGYIMAQIVAGVRCQSEVTIHQRNQGEGSLLGWKSEVLGRKNTDPLSIIPEQKGWEEGPWEWTLNLYCSNPNMLILLS